MDVRPAFERIGQVLTHPLPFGHSMPDRVWRKRHRWTTLLLGAQAAGLLLAAGLTGTVTLAAATAFGSLFAVTIGLALIPRLRRPWRSGAVAVGLVGCSTLLIHLTGGWTESHFHLFLVLSVIALYQEWLPFVLALGMATLHHGAAAFVAPDRVFGSAAGGRPLAWAAVYVGFLVAAAAVNLISWRLGERDRATAQRVLDATADGVHGIDTEGRVTFANAALAELLETTQDDLLGRHHHEALRHVTDPAGDCPICTTASAGRDRSDVSARLRAGAGDGRDLPVECSATPLWEDRAIVGTVVTVRDASERQRLAEQALHDPLTGLANRTLLRAHLERAIAALDRRRDMAALLFCDLDRFKQANDHLGHAAGDALLVTIAERLETAVRGHDTVARFGGDEFVVLCTELSSARNVMAVAERLADAIREPVMIDGEDAHLSASIGIAMFDDPSANADDLLEEADLAMYRAKERGRDRIEVFDERLRERAARRMQLEQELREALRRGELDVHYQPKVGLADGKLAGVEALARWRHPQRGPLSPHEFLPVAEEARLMPDLGRWVLEQSCRQVQRWRAAHPGAEELTLSVNLSRSQLRDRMLPQTVEDVLARTGMPPGLLCLEIGELALADDTPSTVECLHALKRLGVRLAVDDFGTGWSSLSYLSRVPIDVLKVDRTFVATLDEQGDSWSIVSAAIGLSRALGLSVVAEGVERPEQADALRALGYEMAQGYHFHRPLEPRDLEALLLAAPVAERA